MARTTAKSSFCVVSYALSALFMGRDQQPMGPIDSSCCSCMRTHLICRSHAFVSSMYVNSLGDKASTGGETRLFSGSLTTEFVHHLV